MAKTNYSIAGLNPQSRREFLKISAMAGSLAFLPGIISCKNSIRGTKPETGDTDLLKNGIVDVTNAPYFADPKGKKDSTLAIQQAVNDCRDKGLVCFFPSGTYIISDTISVATVLTKVDPPQHPDGGTAHYMPYERPMILLGSGKGKRPLIKLAKDSPLFDDPAKPKYAVRIWAQTYLDAPGKDEPIWGNEQGNISFNHLFLNIDIDVSGHAGAIGIRHSGSQGSALMNSKITATGAYSGMSNCCGQGGGTYNIEVIGGKHGITIDIDSRFPMLNSCVFREQTDSVVKHVGTAIQIPTMLVGCVFEPFGKVLADMASPNPHAGIQFIDCMIEMKGGQSIISTDKKENIFMENTLVKGVKSVFNDGPSLSTTENWMIIEQYSSDAGYGTKIINGKQSAEEVFLVKQADSFPSSESIHTRHFIDIPVFDQKGVVNVMDFGAKGDGTTDDTEAFRKAIAASEKVFVPKGNFKLTGTLELKQKTRLFSYSRSFTSIGVPKTPRVEWWLETMPGPDYDTNLFTLSTADDVNAEPGVFFISVRGKLEWKSGKGTWMLASGRPEFSENGGGKFCGFGAGGTQWIVEGVKQPTAFYALNVERARVNPMSEFRNCENIKIFYFKIEAGSIYSPYKELIKHTPCRISNCNNMTIYSYTGNIISIEEKGPMLEIIDSHYIKVSYIKAFRPGEYKHLREIMSEQIIEVPSDKVITLYRRDL